MAIELEAKIKVEDLASIRPLLEGAGATMVGDTVEINAIFDTEDRSLLAADKGLRVRSATYTSSGQRKCTLTYKGPRRASEFKSREEVEVAVEDFDGMIELLKCLRFVQVLYFEKRRQSWELGGCKVELDELPNLGAYVEIEGSSDKAIHDVQQRLGLGTRPLVKTSYVGLMMTYLQERGSSNRAVVFPK